MQKSNTEKNKEKAILQRSETYTGNKGGECSPVERLAHCLRCAWECPYCGSDLRLVKTISMDHVIPQLLGGAKSDTNIIACCGSCNSSKKAKLLSEFAAGRGDMGIVQRVQRIRRRRLPVYIAQAKKIIGEQG